MRWQSIIMLAAEALLLDNEDKREQTPPHEPLRTGDARLDTHLERLNRELLASENPTETIAKVTPLSENLARSLLLQGYEPAEICLLGILKLTSRIPLANILYYKEHGVAWADMPERLGLKTAEVRLALLPEEKQAEILPFRSHRHGSRREF